MSLGQFIAHVAGAAAQLDSLENRALHRAAGIVEQEAKREIGHYQGEAGPFAAWAELAERTKDDRVHQGFSENEPGLRTGAMRDDISHEVGHREAVVGSNADELVFFELGTATQPPRSVLGTAAVHKVEAVACVLGAAPVVALVGEDVVNRFLPIKS